MAYGELRGELVSFLDGKEYVLNTSWPVLGLAEGIGAVVAALVVDLSNDYLQFDKLPWCCFDCLPINNTPLFLKINSYIRDFPVPDCEHDHFAPLFI